MNILVIGDAMTDEYVYTTCERKSPEDDRVNVYKPKTIERKLGGALNVAANIASLLGDKHLVNFSGIISKSQIKLANSFNVNTPNLICHKINNNRIIKKQRIICNGKQVCRIDYNDKFSQARNLYQMFYRFPDFERYDCIVVSDYDKGTVYCDLPKDLQDYKGLVLLDTKKTDFQSWHSVKNCIVKINANEHEKSKNINALERIVTTGKDGSRYYRKGDDHWQYSCLADLNLDANVIGAGDAYLAGMVADYIDKGCVIDIPSMMQSGTMAASQSVSSFGTENKLNPLNKQGYPLIKGTLSI